MMATLIIYSSTLMVPSQSYSDRKPMLKQIVLRADPEIFVRGSGGGGGGSKPTKTLTVRFSLVEGVLLQCFPVFHGINNWTPSGIQLFILWKTFQGGGVVLGLIPMETCSTCDFLEAVRIPCPSSRTAHDSMIRLLISTNHL